MAASHLTRRRSERRSRSSPDGCAAPPEHRRLPARLLPRRIGGPQTQPFILAPSNLPLPDGPIIGAASVHELLTVWRRLLNGGDTREAAETEPVAVS
jgi:hypothetical protein